MESQPELADAHEYDEQRRCRVNDNVNPLLPDSALQGQGSHQRGEGGQEHRPARKAGGHIGGSYQVLSIRRPLARSGNLYNFHQQGSEKERNDDYPYHAPPPCGGYNQQGTGQKERYNQVAAQPVPDLHEWLYTR